MWEIDLRFSPRLPRVGCGTVAPLAEEFALPVDDALVEGGVERLRAHQAREARAVVLDVVGPLARLRHVHGLLAPRALVAP